jgi:hypothetical protein
MNPSYLTGILPGGAGTVVAGVTTNPGISAPRLEESTIEVLDVTAPTTLSAVTNAVTYPTPAPAGKLLVMDWTSAIGGSRWKLSNVNMQPIARGQYGIVVAAGAVQNVSQNDAGPAITTNPSGTTNINEAQFGTKAVVMYDGPVLAFCTTLSGQAISAGSPLGADGGGNLMLVSTPSFATPGVAAPGQVLARALGPLAASISTPTLIPIYVGGY